MQYLALLCLAAVCAATPIIGPIGPIEPIEPIDPIHQRIEIFLPGWPTCPDHCFLAVPDKSLSNGQEPVPVCFDEPAPRTPCNYYYCCDKPVSSAVLVSRTQAESILSRSRAAFKRRSARPGLSLLAFGYKRRRRLGLCPNDGRLGMGYVRGWAGGLMVI